MFHGLIITKIIKGSVSEFWDDLSESKRAKLDDPHDGDAHGEILVRNLMKVLRRQKRRICDICSRFRPLEEDRFPVCWCGARRYCGEECQKADWAAGHAQTCASGHTWSATDLDFFRRLEQQWIQVEGNLEYPRSDLAALEEGMQRLIAKNPLPADRAR